MTDPVPYLLLPGTARSALTFYGQVFGCTAEFHTFAEAGRRDGPPDAIAHGYLREGPVTVFAADTFTEGEELRGTGLMLSLLGTADPNTLRHWFAVLAEEGSVVDPLQKRPWGDSDGQVIDWHHVHWLIGFQGE